MPFFGFHQGVRLASKAKVVEDSWWSQHAELAEETKEEEGATTSKPDKGLSPPLLSLCPSSLRKHMLEFPLFPNHSFPLFLLEVLNLDQFMEEDREAELHCQSTA